jgi:adenosylcobinamide-phosphate synthase
MVTFALPTALLAGAALDLSLGDPRWLPHPVRAIGHWASALERRLWSPSKLAGALFWLFVIAPVALIAWAVVTWLPWTSVYWIYTLLAIRSLDQETSRAVHALAVGDLAGAREAIAMVVGRDTAQLDESGVLRAALETLSENLSDAVVAPLFYLALAGPAAMAAYKAINTLDSMVGFKNNRYGAFGWFSARADDWANWIPARLTALLIAICGMRFADAWRVTWRDAHLQPSPNSGWPEAAMAGALGVQLGGLAHYQGRPSHKAHLGDATRPLSIAIYAKARIIHYAVSLLAVALAWSILR